MFDRLWDSLVSNCQAIFIPLICSYYSIAGCLFLNSASSDAVGLEWVGDLVLSPFQYVFCGQIAVQTGEGAWKYTQRFNYERAFWIRTVASIAIIPIALPLGAALKGIACLSSVCRERVAARQAYYLNSQALEPHLEQYREWGLKFDTANAPFYPPQVHERRPGDENHLALEKEALREIGRLLTEAAIPWWIDCGTCLGAYRYGGVIPWDEDIDVAVLEPDFDNVRRVLLQLDPQKYLLQDWSGRLNPQNYFKVYIKQTGTLVDIYHFAIDPEKKTVRYILSLETSSVFPEWWKIRERRFTAAVSFDTVFPLKRALFDGIEVFIPNNPAAYLQRYYGENLDPVKVYNPLTDRYEKALDHPYWQRQYAH